MNLKSKVYLCIPLTFKQITENNDLVLTIT